MNHIGSNFDDFLKEENIEIKEEEIRERLKMHNKSIEIIDNGTRFVDDGKLHTIHFNISREAERIMREINKEIDDEVFKRLPKEKLIKLRERIDIELQRRYEENENN